MNRQPSAVSGSERARRLPHLTYARQAVTPDTKGRAFPEIAQALKAARDKFADSVNPDLLGPRWRNGHER
jgi:hypothetical protein